MPKQILDQENKKPAIIHVEPREAVKELLTALKKAKEECETLNSQLDQDILEKITSRKEYIEIIEKEIKELVSFEVQESIKTNDGCATFRKGHTLITYPYKELDAIKDKNIRKEIDKYRKETTTKGSVTIDIY